jgi:S-adenosylmethionine decarboxylase
MLLKKFESKDYFFGDNLDNTDPEEHLEIKRRLRQEMLEIFYGRNIADESKLPQHTGSFE